MDTSPDISDGVSDVSDQPKKYVRTYAEDLEIAQKGGTPTLHPMETPTPSPTQAPAVPVPPPAPAPAPRPAPPPRPVPVPMPPPVHRIPSPPRPAPLQTYDTDFAERVKETHASPATILAADQDAHQTSSRHEVEEKKSSRMTRVYAVLGVLLLMASGVGIYMGYMQYMLAHLPILVTPTIPSPILVDDRVKVSGTGGTLMQAIAESVNVPLSVGTVRLLYTSGSATTSNAAEPLFTSLHTRAPGMLVRNITAQGSMAGIISTKGSTGGQSAFFILSVTSYNETFAGMLAWEPQMPSDLSALFFPRALALVTASSTTATSTAATSTVSTLPALPPTPQGPVTFVDETVANHDVRMYRDARGQSILLYGYWNPKTLIIARDPATFTDLLSRLANARP